jgi:CRISPR system Cascade subunit CasB
MSETSEPNKYQRFVESIITLTDKKNGTAAAAALKRADNQNLEYQSWEYLARLNVDIEDPNEHLPYATIACAMAKAKAEQNGKTKIGAAIAKCYEEGSESDQATAKLRRLLACDSIEEICQVLRPLFSLINSKAGIQLDYADLLKDLRWFYKNSQQTKAKWAQNFYRHSVADEVNP